MANNSVLIAIKGDLSDLKKQLKDTEKFIGTTQDEIYKKNSELIKVKNDLTKAQENYTDSIKVYMNTQEAASGDEKKSAAEIKKELSEKNKEYNNSVALLKQQKKLIEAQIVRQREILRYNSEYSTGLKKEVDEKKKLVAIDEEYNNNLKNQYQEKINNFNSVLKQYEKEEAALKSKGQTAQTQIDKEIEKEEKKQARIISNLAEQRRLEAERNAETLRQQEAIFNNLDDGYEQSATRRANEIQEENRLRRDAASALYRRNRESIQEESRLRADTEAERARLEEETLRQGRERQAQLERQYELTYQNTAAQNRYNTAFANLEEMRTTGAISQSQYNDALATERQRLDESSTARTSGTNVIVRNLRQIETLIVAYYTLSQGFKATIGVGIEMNKVVESNTYGIAALISTNAAFIDSQGNAVNAAEKFAMAQNNSTKALSIIKKESLEVGATFKELTEIYQQMIGHTLSAGEAFGTSINEISENTIKFSKRLASFAEGIGMPLDRVREEARSLTSGTASADSLIASIVFGSPSAANNAIKEAKKHTNGLTDLFNKMFSDFDVLASTRTYTKGLAQLTGAWQIAMGDMVEKSELFSDITDAYYDMANAINDGNDEIVDTFDAVYSSIKAIVGVMDNVLVPAAFLVGMSTLTKVIPAVTTAVLALTAAVARNPLISAGLILGTGIYTLAEYFEDQKAAIEEYKNVIELEDISGLSEAEIKEQYDSIKKVIELKTKELMKTQADVYDTSFKEKYFSILETDEQEGLDEKKLALLKKELAQYKKMLTPREKALKLDKESIKNRERLKEIVEVINKIGGSSTLVELAQNEIEAETKLALLKSRRIKLQQEYNTHAKATEQQLKRITDAAEDGKDISEAEVLAYEKLLRDKEKGEEGLEANANAIAKEKQDNLNKEIALRNKMIKSEYELQKAESKYLGSEFSKVDQLEEELILNEENINNLIENGAKQEVINKALKNRYNILAKIGREEEKNAEDSIKKQLKSLDIENNYQEALALSLKKEHDATKYIEEKIRLKEKEIVEAKTLTNNEDILKKLATDKLKLENELTAEKERQSKVSESSIAKEIRAKVKLLKSDYELAKIKSEYSDESNNEVDYLNKVLGLVNELKDELEASGSSQEDINKVLIERYGILLGIRDINESEANERKKNIKDQKELLALKERYNAIIPVVSDGYFGAVAESANSMTNTEYDLYDDEAAVRRAEAELELTKQKGTQNEIMEAQNKLAEKQFEVQKSIYDLEMERINNTYDPAIKQLEKVDETGNKYLDTITGIAKINLKSSKADEKATKEINDLNEKGKLTTEESNKLKNLESQQLENQIAAYSDMAGAVAGVFEAGSDAQQALLVAQQALAVTNGVITVLEFAKGTGPTAPAALAAGIAVVSGILAMADIAFGGGGGGVSAPSAMEVKQAELDANYEPLLEKYDKQIELLESIDKNGSAQLVEVSKSKEQYDYDMGTFINEMTAGFASESGVQGNYSKKFANDEQWEALISRLSAINDEFGEQIWTVGTNSASLNSKMINTSESFIKYTAILSETGNEAMLNWASRNVSREQNISDARAKVYAMQEIMADFAISSVESLSELTDTKDDLSDFYDSITLSSKYANEKMIDSFKKVNEVIGDSNLTDFLEENIAAIQLLKNDFSEAELDSLFSLDITDFSTQQETLYRLNEKLGTAYSENDSSLKKLINSMDDFDLVTEAIATSNENIKDFSDSLKTDFQLAMEMAADLGQELPETMEDVTKSFNELSGGVDGLNDAELEFLDTSRDLVEAFDALKESSLEFIAGIREDLETMNMTSAEGYQYAIDAAKKDIENIISATYKTSTNTSYSNVATGEYEGGSYEKTREQLVRDVYADFTKDTEFYWNPEELEKGVSYWVSESGANLDTLITTMTDAFEKDIVGNARETEILANVDTSDVSMFNEEVLESVAAIWSTTEDFYSSVTDLESAIAKYDEATGTFGMDEKTIAAGEKLVSAYAAIIENENNLAKEADTDTDTDTTTTEADVNDNIKIYLDSFKTSFQLAVDMADGLGVDIAGTVEELNNVFDTLKEGVGGLTDEELAFLQANKAIIDERDALSQELDILSITDATEKLNYQRELELENLDESTAAIQRNIWAEQDRQDALNDATATLETYIEGLVNSNVEMIESYKDIQESISDTLYEINDTKTYWQDVIFSMNNIENDEDATAAKELIDTYYSEQMELLEKKGDVEEESLSNRINILQTEKDILDSLKDFASNLTTEQLVENLQTDALKSIYENSFSTFNTALLAGDEDVGDLSDDAMSSATSYLNSLKDTADSREYDYQTSVLANRFNGVEGTGDDATLDDLNEQLKALAEDSEEDLVIQGLQEISIDELTRKTREALSSLDSSLSYEILRTKNEIIGLQGEAERYLGADSDVVEWLKKINTSNDALGLTLAEYLDNESVEAAKEIAAATTTYSSGGNTYSSRSEAQANADATNAANAANLAAFNSNMTEATADTGAIFSGGRPLPKAFVSSSSFIPFAVGSPNVPYDMPANIHQGEMILPQTFAEGVRNGSVTVGGNQDALVKEIRGLREENRQMKNYMVQLVKYNKDIKDISNESLISLQERGESY